MFKSVDLSSRAALGGRGLNRRTFLRTNGILGAGFALSKAAPALVQPPPTNDWRTFEVTTRVELLKPAGVCHIWLPAALILDTPYQRTHFNHYTAPGASATLDTDKQQALGVISAAFPDGRKAYTHPHQSRLPQELHRRSVLQGIGASRPCSRT